MGHHQVREVEFAAVMIAFFVPVLPHVGEEIRYEPLGRWKVATPVLPVRDERFVLAPVTFTSALATGCCASAGKRWTASLDHGDLERFDLPVVRTCWHRTSAACADERQGRKSALGYAKVQRAHPHSVGRSAVRPGWGDGCPAVTQSPPRPARGGRAYHHKDKEHPENSVQTFIGIAADSEDSNAAGTDADDDTLQQRAKVVSFGWRC